LVSEIILVVEDDETIRELMESVLEQSDKM